MENDAPRLRLAGRIDLRQLAELRWRLKTEDAAVADPCQRDAFITAFIDLVSKEDPGFVHWVAEIAGRIVGVMSVRKIVQLPSPGRLKGCWGYLTNSYVLPEYRDRGVGRHLLDATRRWAEEQGCELLTVWPSDRSYPFYERGGFRRLRDPLVLEIDEVG